MGKEKQNSTLKSNDRIKKHILDLTFVVIFLLILAFEVTSIFVYKNISSISEGTNATSTMQNLVETEEAVTAIDKYHDFITNLFTNETLTRAADSIRDYVNTTITILFPLVISIVVISISASREEIYGVTLAKFRALDLKAKYTVKGMVVFTIIIVAFSVALYCVSCTLSLLVLNVISLYYAICFVCQEIPTLTRSSNKLQNVIVYALAYKYYSSGDNKKTDNFARVVWNQDLDVVSANLINEIGIKEVIDRVQKEVDGYGKEHKH